LFAAIALACSLAKISAAAAPEDRKPQQARGSLTVSATVVSSAQLIIDQDGKQHLTIANAPDLPRQASPQKLDLFRGRSEVKASSPGAMGRKKR
jgi:hypothetical protein